MAKIAKPLVSGVSVSYNIKNEENIDFLFTEEDASFYQQGNTMVVSFDNGSSIILHNFFNSDVNIDFADGASYTAQSFTEDTMQNPTSIATNYLDESPQYTTPTYTAENSFQASSTASSQGSHSVLNISPAAGPTTASSSYGTQTRGLSLDDVIEMARPKAQYQSVNYAEQEYLQSQEQPGHVVRQDAFQQALAQSQQQSPFAEVAATIQKTAYPQRNYIPQGEPLVNPYMNIPQNAQSPFTVQRYAVNYDEFLDELSPVQRNILRVATAGGQNAESGGVGEYREGAEQHTIEYTGTLGVNDSNIELRDLYSSSLNGKSASSSNHDLSLNRPTADSPTTIISAPTMFMNKERGTWDKASNQDTLIKNLDITTEVGIKEAQLTMIMQKGDKITLPNGTVIEGMSSGSVTINNMKISYTIDADLKLTLTITSTDGSVCDTTALEQLLSDLHYWNPNFGNNPSIDTGNRTGSITLIQGDNQSITSDVTVEYREKIADNFTSTQTTGSYFYQGSDASEKVDLSLSKGSNLIVGGGGKDTLIGGSGDDIIIVGGSTNGNQMPTIYNPNATDGASVNGGQGSDTIIGSLGSDTILAGEGNDLIFGGTIDVDSNNAPVWNSSITGESASNILVGGDGNNTIVAGKQGDLIFGASAEVTTADSTIGGNNLIYTGAGNDTVHAGGGNNTIMVTQGQNSIYSGAGNDVIKITGGNSSIQSGAGADSITVEKGNNTINADSGANTIIIQNGNNSVTAGSDNDNVTLANGKNTVSIAGGNNTITIQNGSQSVTVGNGNDNIDISAGNNTINAGIGNNTITIKDGNNSISTGSDHDNISITSGKNTISAGEGNNTIAVQGGNQHITTGSGNDSITLAGGNNTLQAGNGSNTIAIHGGSQHITTESGNDNITITGGYTHNINVGSGSNTINMSDSNGTISTGGDSDNISITNGSTTVNAGAGNNNINISGGNHHITTGNDSDTIQASGSGNVTINAGEGNNNIILNNSSGNITTGSGNDFISVNHSSGIIHTGNGNNTVLIKGDYSGTINMGSGKNDIIAFGSSSQTNLDNIKLYEAEAMYFTGNNKYTITSQNLSSIAQQGENYFNIKGSYGIQFNNKQFIISGDKNFTGSLEITNLDGNASILGDVTVNGQKLHVVTFGKEGQVLLIPDYLADNISFNGTTVEHLGRLPGSIKIDFETGSESLDSLSNALKGELNLQQGRSATDSEEDRAVRSYATQEESEEQEDNPTEQEDSVARPEEAVAEASQESGTNQEYTESQNENTHNEVQEESLLATESTDISDMPPLPINKVSPPTAPQQASQEGEQEPIGDTVLDFNNVEQIQNEIPSSSSEETLRLDEVLIAKSEGLETSSTEDSFDSMALFKNPAENNIPDDATITSVSIEKTFGDVLIDVQLHTEIGTNGLS